jgi:putative transposase
MTEEERSGSRSAHANESGRHGGRPSIYRAHPVHQPIHERYGVAVIVFVTICTKSRKPILSNAAAHETLLTAWHLATSWQVGRYVLMPDHVHLFCAPAATPARPLLQWISYWKSEAARIWPVPDEAPIWQRHFWDTQLRHGESYDEKWEYVIQNPVRASLVRSPNDWPYQGELHQLRW